MASSQPRLCFNVEKIIGVRLNEGNVRSYHVQWEPVWISSQYLIGCEQLVEQFLQQQHDERQQQPKQQQLKQLDAQQNKQQSAQQQQQQPPQEQHPQQHQEQQPKEELHQLELQFREELLDEDQEEDPQIQEQEELHLESQQLQQQLQEQQQQQQLHQQHQHLQQQQQQQRQLQEKQMQLEQQQQSEQKSKHQELMQQLRKLQQQQQQAGNLRQACEQLPKHHFDLEHAAEAGNHDDLITIVTPQSPVEHTYESLSPNPSLATSDEHEGSTIHGRPTQFFTSSEDRWEYPHTHEQLDDSDDEVAQLDTEMETNSAFNWLDTDISIYDTENRAPDRVTPENDHWTDAATEPRSVYPNVRTVYLNTEEIVRRSKKTTDGGFLCDICGKMYTRRYGLKIHLRTHTGFKPNACPHCSKTFADPSNLVKHMRVHGMGNRSYECPYCAKMLVRKRDLERHVRSRHPMEHESIENVNDVEINPKLAASADEGALDDYCNSLSSNAGVLTTVGPNQESTFATHDDAK